MVANKQTPNSKENSHILNSPPILIAHSELIRIRAWALLPIFTNSTPILKLYSKFEELTPNSKFTSNFKSSLQILKFYSKFETLTMWFWPTPLCILKVHSQY